MDDNDDHKVSEIHPSGEAIQSGAAQSRRRDYETPRLIALGAVRDLTQTPPPILDCSGIACAD